MTYLAEHEIRAVQEVIDYLAEEEISYIEAGERGDAHWHIWSDCLVLKQMLLNAKTAQPDWTRILVMALAATLGFFLPR